MQPKSEVDFEKADRIAILVWFIPIDRFLVDSVRDAFKISKNPCGFSKPTQMNVRNQLVLSRGLYEPTEKSNTIN